MTDPELQPYSIEAWTVLVMRDFWRLSDKRYRQHRRREARKNGNPYARDLDKPEPGVLDLAVEDEG